MTNNENQQKQLSHIQQAMATVDLKMPIISTEQLVAHTIRLQEIQKTYLEEIKLSGEKRMREEMNSLLQTIFPHCKADINSILPASSSQFGASCAFSPTGAPQTAQTLPLSASSSSRTFVQVSLPENVSNGNSNNNISKVLPFVNILSLICNEPKSLGEEKCLVKLRTEEEFQEHQLQKHRIYKYRCLSKGCNRSFDRLKLREEHVANVHKDGLVCRSCPKRVKTNNGMAGHYQMYHQEGLYQCIHCTNVEALLVNMRKHIKKCPKNSANNFLEPVRSMRSDCS